MNPLLICFGVALAASLLLTPLARSAAVRLGVVDTPDGRRKLQRKPVPLWGGIAVYFALLAGLLAAQAMLPQIEKLSGLIWAVAPACGFVCLLGCIDDRWDLNGRFKLLLQAASVLPVVLSGHYFDRVVAFGVPIDFGWLGVPLTVLWLVGCINALNLLDGMDGLASVVGLSSALIMAVIATSDNHPEVAVVAVVLAGALAGFLAFNLPPASIYLGDSGSMVIGLVAGIISMQGALKTTATLSIAVPAVVMSIPMLDTALAIVRRKLTGQRFDSADRGHIHHRLLERGLSDWQALCIIGALCLTTGAAATAATILRYEALGWVTALALFVVLIRTRAFGHHELALVKQSASKLIAAPWTWASRYVRYVRGEHGTEATHDFAVAWSALTAKAARSGAATVELSIVGESNRIRRGLAWRRAGSDALAPSAWSLTLSLAPTAGTVCQLRAAGPLADRSAARPFARLSREFHEFGLYWAARADCVPLADAVGLAESEAFFPANGLRDAA